MNTSTGTRYNTGPTVALSVGGLRGAWNNGIFAGDSDLVEFARRSARVGAVVNLYRARIQARPDTALGAVAALAAYDPGRVFVTQAPLEVLDVLTGHVPAPPIAEAPYPWTAAYHV